MRHLARAFLTFGAGIFLLAAGEAPIHNSGGDLAFLNDIAPAPLEAPSIPAADSVDASIDYAEPSLGPILPESATLAQMVRGVRTLESVEMDQQLTCLATAVYFESKGEPLDGQLAVAQVILNRVEKGRFGRDICAVVKAPRQFSFVRGGQLPAPTRTDQWHTARAIAVIASAEGWPEIVQDATHFHATRVNPGWKMRRVATVGRHVFYR
jgi:spore germination cell wall hydrolase CwlJ-like protein